MKSHLLLPLFAMVFGFVAQAQDETPSMTSRKTKSSSYAEALATPSLFFSGMIYISNTQNFLAPQSGTQVELGLRSTQYKLSYTSDNSKSSSDLNDQVLSADIATAINENLFFDLNFNYRDMRTASELKDGNDFSRYTGKRSGVSDPILSINGRINGSRVSTILGLGFGAGTGDAENERKSDSDTGV